MVTMEEENITLDRKTFKTLSSDTRVGILKSLKRRRKMLTELSREFGMSPSTIKGHMEKLAGADLVVQKDDGHKWKYYELTRKGKDVLNPGETKIWIVLALSLVAITATSWDFLQTTFQRASPMFTETKDMMGQVAGALPPQVGAEAAYLPYWHVAAFVVFSLILGVSIGYLLAKKKFYTFQGEFD